MTSPTPATPRSAAAPAARNPRWRPVRRRFWLLLAAAGLLCLPFHPPVWHAALRTWLVWQARRHGYDLTIAAVDGGLFDTTQLHGLRCCQHGPAPSDGSAGTDVFIARADLTLAWSVPWLRRPAPSWVRSVVLEGVRGRWDLHGLDRAPVPACSDSLGTGGRGSGPAMIRGDVFARALGAVFPPLHHFSTRLQPETFLLRAEDLRLERGRYFLDATGLRLSGSRDDDGQFMAQTVTIAGPGFENTLVRPHGRTYWQDSRLTLSPLVLGPDVSLVSVTLDGSHLNRRQLDCECKLTALGGEVHGQGAVDFSHDRLALEVAASLRGTAVRPLASLLGIAVPADGLIDQGSFTFRGDPENWSAAQMWLAAHATDFRWGKRRWRDLELQAVVVNRRVQVHRLELRQNANRVSLTGECPLPPAPAEARDAADALRQWREGGFSCQVDARLEDLHALADLFGPEAPELAGRLSVNGVLNAQPGAQQDIDGYLTVEGSRLILRGAPLDSLRSTLLFKDGIVRMADLQATRGGDYFTGTGSLRLDGPPRFTGELRARVGQLSAYTPALAGMPLADGLARVSGLSVRLRWDDSVLAFDECSGQLEGAPFTVGGRIDLRDATHPVLDLSLAGEDLALGSVGDGMQTRADYALTMHGQIGNGPVLAGDVRLLGGMAGFGLDLVSYPGQPQEDLAGTDLPAEPFFSPDDWLPSGWQDWDLDLAITADAPLRDMSGGGEATPDLHITKTGRSPSPEITGRIDLSGWWVGGLGLVQGALYFPGGPDQGPDVSLTVTSPSPAGGLGPEGTWYYGPSTRLRAASEATARLIAQPLTGDTTPWAEWLAAPAAAQTGGEYALTLR